MVAYRQYIYLKLLARTDQDVQQKFDPGSLAVLCPACPQPGINMDPKWQERPLSEL
jgi:hypothetical protein